METTTGPSADGSFFHFRNFVKTLILAKMSDKPDYKAQSDTGEEYIEKARKADVAPKLTCKGCNGFFRGTVIYCQNKHGLCSICFGHKKECPTTGCGQKAILTLDFPAELVKNLKFPVSCKFKKYGCNQENADEEVITDHEKECGYRKVPCFAGGCPEQPAMELEAHVFSAHEAIYGKFRDNPGKWFFQKFTNHTFTGAQKQWIDPESGLRFRAILFHNDEGKYWSCFTVVFAGENVAKSFRAEMRLSSHDVDSSHIFNCNVLCLDNWEKADVSKEFRIMNDQFKICNKGHIELGYHNKDKNGELTMPVTVEVKMRKLNAS